jgi:hypothetical protein
MHCLCDLRKEIKAAKVNKYMDKQIKTGHFLSSFEHRETEVCQRKASVGMKTAF